MMSSMDAEAEMEGLFGGEDQGQEEEAQTQSLTQEEREAGEANLDVTGAGGDGEKKKKTVIRKPIPKLDNERIMGARGVHTLEELFADFKPHGKGREFEDLDVVMKKMEHWAHRLFPKLPFNSVLDIIANRLGKRKVVQTHVKKIRLGMLHQPSKDEDNVQPAEEEDDREVERYGEGGGEDQDEVEDFFSNMAGRQVNQSPPPASSRPLELTEEQKEKMRKNKEAAFKRKREKEEREAAQKRKREKEEEEQEEIEREMLTGASASEWGPRSEVEASCLKTVQELSLKRKESEDNREQDEAVQDSSAEAPVKSLPSPTDVNVEGEVKTISSNSPVKAPLESETEDSRSKVKETDIQDGVVLPSEENDDDLSLAQMMEEMEEDDMEGQGEETKEAAKEETNVISLDQMMDVMEED